MNRRQLIKTICATPMAFLLPQAAIAKPNITIAKIMNVVFEPCLNEMRPHPNWGPRTPQITPRFWKGEKEIAIPICWTMQNDSLPKYQMVELCRSLITNTIDTANMMAGGRRIKYWSLTPFSEREGIVRWTWRGEIDE